ncbi:response regulator transcription factor [Streptomyces asoensis]|uniref:response regulator transcription factor n=1 Tax=Streptomyces asoensis TaxID=249586 RepID=UPI003404CD01
MRAPRHPRRDARGDRPAAPADAPAHPGPPGEGRRAETPPSPGREPSLARGAGRRVLVVAAEPDLAELLATTLGLAGYRAVLAGTLAEALARLGAQRFDLAVVDTALPGLAGYDAAGRPAIAHRPPVLYLAACDLLGRLLPELAPGEKDCITKPLRVAEVLTRMQVLLRATAPGSPGRAPGYGDLVVDDVLRRARRGDRDLGLTPAEYRLLRHLLDNPHRVLSKEQLGRYVRGGYRGDNAVEQLVSRLRRKVDRGGAALIHTRRGFGYWLGKADTED